MKRYILLNFTNIQINGNILDVCADENGILYDLVKQICKDSDKIEDVNYIEKDNSKLIEKNFYNTCFLFFVLSSIMFSAERKKLIKQLHSSIDENGILYIWDINKKFFKIFNAELKVYFPDKSSQIIHLKEYNLLSSMSKMRVLKDINKYFKIINYKDYGGVYLIKARRRDLNL